MKQEQLGPLFVKPDSAVFGCVAAPEGKDLFGVPAFASPAIDALRKEFVERRRGKA